MKPSNNEGAMPLSLAQQDYLRDVGKAVGNAPHGDKRALVKGAAKTLGMSVQTVYRHLETMGLTPGARGERKKRSDAGKRSVGPDLALTIGGMVQTARRLNDKKTMTVEGACAIQAANGLGVVDPETGEVAMPHHSTVMRTMRELGCHPKQLKRGSPTGRVRSRHPNASAQLDSTVCVLYRFGGKIAIMDERLYNERKPGKLVEINNLRIIRYVYTDHATHNFYLHYVLAPGENAAGVLETLIAAMSDRGPRDPMHGIPGHLYLDPSSAHRSSLLAEFCKRLGTKLQHHTPGRANATGSVEKAHHIVETQFEGRFRFTAVQGLEELQALADKWRMHYNATAIHSRHGMSRNAAWQKIRAEQLRTASREALAAVCHWGHVERTVSGSMTISVDTKLPGIGKQEYDLRNLANYGVVPGDKVLAELNPFRAPDIYVIKKMPDGSERRWEVSPIMKDEWGFDASAPVMGESYKAMPKTLIDHALDDIQNIANPSGDA
jgi:transposase InsO family protein